MAQDFSEQLVDFAFMMEGDNFIIGHGLTPLREVRTSAPLRRGPHAVITHQVPHSL
jgi:hypothetical protein